jgi:DNA-binding SARP family transcriptional activator
MRVLAAGGDRAEAVRAYNQCRDLLQRELGVAPSAETEALYREISGNSRPSP